MLDPYAKVIFNGRQRWGDMGPVRCAAGDKRGARRCWRARSRASPAPAGAAARRWSRAPDAQTAPLLPLPPASPPARPRQDLAYGSPGVLGLAATWPQAAAALPAPPGAPAFDWEGDRPLGLPMEDLVIYEMHVRGFTADPASGVSAPGECAPPAGRPPGGGAEGEA